MSNHDKARYKSSIGFTDLLFNLVIGFVFLFLIAFIMINPVAKRADIEKKAEFIIVIEWSQRLNDDIDLWVKDPQGNVVSFMQKSSGVMNLEKDDLGYSNDVLKDGSGAEKIIHTNREVVTLRGTSTGEYQVMAHVYNRHVSVRLDGTTGKNFPGEVRVNIIQINPYYEHYTQTYNYSEKGQTISLVRFTLSEEGDVVRVSNAESDFVLKRRNNPFPLVPSLPSAPLTPPNSM